MHLHYLTKFWSSFSPTHYANSISPSIFICDFPPHITVWSMAFLEDRKQFVRLNGNKSTTKPFNAGAPQGTRSGPNDFKLLINNLCFDVDYAKYVDDITMSSVSLNACDNSLQSAANYLCGWTLNNGMRINVCKTKEMLIHLSPKTNLNSVPNIVINGEEVERVTTFKLLGVVFSSDLSWDSHVAFVLSKTAKRMYCIRLLVRARVRQSDIVQVYCSIIRSVLEYACPVWHPGLTKTQSDDLERVQRRCLKLIYPSNSYNEALSISGLERLAVRRENITMRLFNEMKADGHVLHNLLPKRVQSSSVTVRNSYPYHIPITKATRYGRAFIPYCISKRY